MKPPETHSSLADSPASEPPRFAIIDTFDAPCRNRVAEWKPGIGYCYMIRKEYPWLQQHDGMKPSRPTSMEDFGFDVELLKNEAIFTKRRQTIATYEDGGFRRWQDIDFPDAFALPLVGKVKRPKRPAPVSA